MVVLIDIQKALSPVQCPEQPRPITPSTSFSLCVAEIAYKRLRMEEFYMRKNDFVFRMVPSMHAPRAIFMAFTAIALWLVAGPAVAGDIWLHMLTSGQPAATRYLGDTIGEGSSWYAQFEVGQATWDTTEVGVGTNAAADDGSWNWGAAGWFADGAGSNKQVQRDVGTIQLTSVGSWYMNGRAKADSGDSFHYANDTSWGNSSLFSPAYYFTVSSLNDPSSVAAVTGVGTPTTEVDLSWTKWNGRDVMVVRSTDSSFTDPTGGTTYNVNDTIGGDTVIYRAGGTSTTDTGLDSDTTYYYKVYSENYSYYSAGATANATTDAAPQPAIAHGPATLDYTMIRGALPATQDFAVTNSGGGTLAYTNTLSYGPTSGWLSVSIADSTLVATAAESTTVSVTISNLAAGIYFATNTITGNQTNGAKTVVIQLTVDDPDDPSISSGAVDGAHPATRIDLAWAKNGVDHDVMIVRSTDASFTAPSDGVLYDNTESIGGDPVIYKGGLEVFENIDLLEGTTYYYKFYSEHFGSYSAGVVTNVTTGVAQTRNTSGLAVEDPSVTIYLGDTHMFGCDSWASIDSAFGKWQVVIDQDADLSDGTEGGYTGYLELEHKTNTSARFTATGTWYWGMQVEYGGTHGDTHWYVSDSSTWVDMATTPVSSLSVDVLALPLVTLQSAITNTVNPTNEIDLVWTPAATPTVGNYQVMIVRKAGGAPSAPTQGAPYVVNDSCGGGTVVYKGFDSSFTDTGLTAGTEYHYAFCSENYNYYASASAANETTAGSGAPFVPSGTVFRFQ
jgi:hypothetical protein